MKKFTIFLLVSFIIFIASFFTISLQKHDVKIKEINGNIIKTNEVKEVQKHYNNTDIKGIIKISGKSYPVAQSTDNDYYLSHNLYKKLSTYGTIMADYRINLDNSKKVLIYGHSSSKKDIPFNILEKYYDFNYYKENKYLTLKTNINNYKYEIFSVYVETNDFTYMNINFDKEQWQKHILKLKSKSMYQTNVSVSGDDDILILQTCSNNKDYQNYEKKYLLIVSRRLNDEKN